MKKPITTEPVIGYNSNGQRHKASNEVLAWLDEHIADSARLIEDFKRSERLGHLDHSLDLDFHTEDGWFSALTFVKRYLENR